jgi:hypothetical protein
MANDVFAPSCPVTVMVTGSSAPNVRSAQENDRVPPAAVMLAGEVVHESTGG